MSYTIDSTRATMGDYTITIARRSNTLYKWKVELVGTHDMWHDMWGVPDILRVSSGEALSYDIAKFAAIEAADRHDRICQEVDDEW